ncbi:hypothetical protein OS493_010747 [Desmophyllum pertusum]|uniref:Uncharacterized protein n=1 Tax=Desmophyllum pertusum TaxID=174260 RepID=A0A9X0CYB4_9CNID|nr:hypothetical protein OS493_010747 [Desmophyllum pertusum]
MKALSSAGFVMGSKNSNVWRAVLVIWIMLAFELFEGVAEICQKIDDCSCKKSNGKVINLRQIDGGSTPAFKDIKDVATWKAFVYSWNPCTKFDDGDGCKGVLMCQQATNMASTSYPCAAAASSFKVDSDGTTSIIYEKIAFENHERKFEIILKCDESKYPGEIGQVTEVQEYPVSAYSTTLTSKCACDDACHNPAELVSSTGILSIGSILVIVDGIVFTYGGVKAACSSPQPEIQQR